MRTLLSKKYNAAVQANANDDAECITRVLVQQKR